MTAEFRDIAAAMPTPVFIITSVTEAKRAIGTTLSAVMPLSLDPMLIVASFDRNSSTLREIRKPGTPLAFNLLAADQQDEVRSFASKADDKFAGVRWTESENGVRLLDRACGIYEGRVEAILPGGDHELVVAAVDHITHHPDRPAMAYWQRGFFSAQALNPKA